MFCIKHYKHTTQLWNFTHQNQEEHEPISYHYTLFMNVLIRKGHECVWGEKKFTLSLFIYLKKSLKYQHWKKSKMQTEYPY